MRLRTLLRAVISCGVVLEIGGCSILPVLGGRFEPPSVALRDSRVAAFSAVALTALFTFTIDNPNDAEIYLRQVRYRLSIKDMRVAEGTQSVGVALSARDSATVTLTVRIQMRPLRSAAPNLFFRTELPYELESWVSVGSLPPTKDVYYATKSALRLDVPLELARER
jgi:LEA14-like dessication related protein